MSDAVLAPSRESVAADDQTAESGQTQQYLRFALGEERCAVRIDLVREILEVAKMTPLPLMPSFVRGVMNLRGAVVPVIDLSARMGLSETVMGRRTCVVIVDINVPGDSSTQPLGVLVDAVHEVFDTLATDHESVPRLGTRIDPNYICSMVRVRGMVMPELNFAAIFDLPALAALIAQHSG